MRILVTGGRDYDNLIAVAKAFDDTPDRCVVIQGGAKGADALAREVAAHHDFAVETYEADWGAHGRAAGPIRNQRMLDEGKPDVVFAFPGGRGTADMVRRAQRAGIAVRFFPHRPV